MSTIDPNGFSAEQILSVDISAPEKLFNQKFFEMELKRLQRKWHPDVNSDPAANDVFVHIVALSKVAKECIRDNTWANNASLVFTTSKNKKYRFLYSKLHKFELGLCYIGKTKVVYVIDEANKDLYDNGIKAINRIKYPPGKFAGEFSKLFPIVTLKDNTDIGYVIVMDKPKNAVLLQDLIDHQPNKMIDPKHVAWIIGSLYNITTFLDHIGICHNSILPSTVFVDPAEHSVMLLGGWWYATKTDDKLKAIPRELLKVLPRTIFDDKLSKTKYDRIAVKGVAVGCLGDPTLVGSKLLTNKELPRSFLNWIRMSSTLSAIEEYSGWDEVMIKSYGKRKFIEFKFNINDIY